MRQFRQFHLCQSALETELPNSLPENDLVALVLRFHTTILDQEPGGVSFAGQRAKHPDYAQNPLNECNGLLTEVKVADGSISA
jgi:hypothetical protein